MSSKLMMSFVKNSMAKDPTVERFTNGFTKSHELACRVGIYEWGGVCQLA
jgi:hypothetical protein